MRKPLPHIIASTLILVVWVYLSPAFMGTAIAALLFYPIWLFVGLFSITFILLQLQSVIQTGWSQIGTTLIISMILTFMIWLPSIQAYTQYRTDRIYETANVVIISVAETGQVPESFYIKGDVQSFSANASREYELTFGAS